VLEVNPRLTGVTPLVTQLYREGQDIPFYLLHILETGNFDYEITDTFVDSTGPEGGLLVLHSQQPTQVRITDVPRSGLYNMLSLDFVGTQYRLGPEAVDRQLLVQQYTPPGFTIRPGGRLVTAYARGRILDDQDALLPEVAAAVEGLLDRIQVREA
jgi:hypothetical protein